MAGSLPRWEVSQVEVTGVYSLLEETCCVGGEVDIVVLKEELSELARSMVPTLTPSATTSVGRSVDRAGKAYGVDDEQTSGEG